MWFEPPNAHDVVCPRLAQGARDGKNAAAAACPRYGEHPSSASWACACRRTWRLRVAGTSGGRNLSYFRNAAPITANSMGTSQAGGYVIRCPWHNERTPSCSVQLRAGIIQAHCFACHHDGEGASVLDMVAAVHGIDVRARFVDVLRAAAELANRPDIIDALDGKADRARPRHSPQPRPPMPPEPERTYPPAAEVSAVWEACTMTADDSEVAAWLQSRALDAVLSGYMTPMT